MRMIFGELDGRSSARAGDFLALCQKAGFDVTLSDQILTELWMKFVLLATNASVTALTRQPIGKLRDDPDIRPVFIAAHQEVIDVARARGVSLPADALDRILEFNSHAPPTMKASMALDLERGNRLELPWLGGKVVGTGPPARRADADAQRDVCDAEAVCDGEDGVIRWKTMTPPSKGGDCSHSSGRDGGGQVHRHCL